jgi:hypothetical protein
MTAASGLSFETHRHSGLRVASMSPNPGCYGNLIRETNKFTLGQDINVKVPHAFMALMNGQNHEWLTSSKMTNYQRLLCENSQVSLETV